MGHRENRTLPRKRVKESESPLWRTGSSRMNRAFYHHFDDPVNFAIPRPNTRSQSPTRHQVPIQHLHNYPRIERYFEPNSSEKDAEQISREFDFLGDDHPSSTVQFAAHDTRIYPEMAPTMVASPDYDRANFITRNNTAHRFLAIFCCILQILIAIGLMAFAIMRYTTLFKKPVGNLMPFSASQGDMYALWDLRTGTCCLLTGILLLLAGFTGLWAFIGLQRSVLLSHCLFAFMTVLFAFDAMVASGLELNIYYSQMGVMQQNDVSVFIAVLTVLSLNVLLLPSYTFGFALGDFAPLARAYRTCILVVFAAGLVILAGVEIGLAVFCLTGTLTPLRDANYIVAVEALHGFGLLELIVGCYSFFAGLFGIFAAVSFSRRLRLVSAFFYFLCFLAIILFILNPDRLIAISYNLRVLNVHKLVYPLPYGACFAISFLYFVIALYLVVLIIITMFYVYRIEYEALDLGTPVKLRTKTLSTVL